MTVLEIPKAPVAPVPDQIPEPTAQQLQALVEVQNHFENLQDGLPVSSQKSDAVHKKPLSEVERFWLTRECMFRFLRACKDQARPAIARLEGALIWRREFGIEGFTAEYISPEQETGKLLFYGFDNAGRPSWYMRPCYQNTPDSDRQLHHMCWFLEQVFWLMPHGVETVSVLVNFAERAKNPSWAISTRSLHILQTHYPCRLGRCRMINVPWIIKGFFKLLMPLMDPATREKMNFENDLSGEVPPHHLEKAFGGLVDFGQYDHESYWNDPETSFCAMAAARRAVIFERWQKAGGHIGISEKVIKEGL